MTKESKSSKPEKDAPTPEPAPVEADGLPLVDRDVVKAHLIAAFTFFFVAIFAGMLYALQFSRLYPFPGVELLSPGRVRMLHTNGVAYGFLMNSFFAMLYWVVPRLTGYRILHKKLSWLVFWAWQGIVGATAVGLLAGQAQAIEWGETPVWIDPVVCVGAVLLIANIATPILKIRARKLYVSLWYFSAMLIWLPLTYIMGNFVPQYFVPGAGGAAVTGLYIHDLVGLTVTPLGWGMMYYFVPVILRKPIWSHTLSLVGFWGLAFFYPLNGVHHFFFSPIPMYAQYGAVLSTIAVEIVVFTVVVNFAMTLRGSVDMLEKSLPLRWFYHGTMLYFVTCLQCAFQTTLTFQKLIHFTDWVPGHAHLVMFGVFSFWIIGMTIYLWPKLCGAPWWSDKLNAYAFWLINVGVWIMFLDLLVAGVAQGYLWMHLAQWEKSLTTSMPFWHIRSVTGVVIIAGVCLQVYNMWMTARSRAGASASMPEPVAAAG